MKKLEPYDYSSEIDMELSQLIALGELMRKVDDPAETREGFFLRFGGYDSGLCRPDQRNGWGYLH